VVGPPCIAERELYAAGSLFWRHSATGTPSGRWVGFAGHSSLFLPIRHSTGLVLGVEQGGRMAWDIGTASVTHVCGTTVV